jgi:hypothetical protein
MSQEKNYDYYPLTSQFDENNDTTLFLSVKYLFVIVVDVFKSLSLSLSPFVRNIYMIFGCQSMAVVKRTL